MSMLEIECPGCHEILEVDRGFAGGVCRCSHCAALMCVPSRKVTERVTRPDAPAGVTRRRPRPSAPARRPDQPKPPPRVVDEQPAPEPVEVPEPESQDTEGVQALQTERVTEVSSTSSGMSFQTDSGKIIRLKGGTTIPVADMKRKAARWATRAVLGGLTALVVLMGIGAIVLVLNQQGGSGIAAVEYEEDFFYDSQTNPFTRVDPNALGMPLGTKTVVVVEASSRSAGTMPLIQQAITKGLPRAGSQTLVGLFYAQAGRTLGVEEGLRPLHEWDASDVEDLHDEVKPSGQPLAVSEAFREACAMQPLKVVLVLAGDLDREVLDAMYDQIDAMAGLRVDALVIGADSAGVEAMTRETGGEYGTLNEETLRAWAKAKE